MAADTLILDDFSPHVGAIFVLNAGDVHLETTLIEANPLQAVSASKFRQPFALLFRSADQEVLPQSIYQLQHAELGLLEIFLVPVARDQTGVSYEAIFN